MTDAPAPTFFIDRSVGNRTVVERLREAGWVCVTMRERYGERSAQELADVDWIADASAVGEVLLTADKRIAKRPLEAAAVRATAAQVFALGNNNSTGAASAEQFLRSEAAILRRAHEPGPWVDSVSARGLSRILG